MLEVLENSDGGPGSSVELGMWHTSVERKIDVARRSYEWNAMAPVAGMDQNRGIDYAKAFKTRDQILTTVL